MKRNEPYRDLLDRLSRRSVEKGFDAYADVDWDAPESKIEKDDPRFILDPTESLGATDWYRSLPPEVQAELGLSLVVQQMKSGWLFENVLSRGLLELASIQPDHSPAFRYAYHEVIEESQHTLMFQEFINRAGVQVPGLSGIHAIGARWVPNLGRTFPELFFIFVLGGEGPIDHVQRRELAKSRPQHPLLERIMRIHVTEEARHICFAKSFLREHVPALSAWKMLQLQIRTPLILWQMATLMLEPPRVLVKRYRIPRAVIREAYRESVQQRLALLDSLADIRELCAELRIATPANAWVWQRLGIWPGRAERAAGALQAAAAGLHPPRDLESKYAE